jgi:PIN domain nuclease of toxin-antitoxin system
MVIDTHTLLWWLSARQFLSERAAKWLDELENGLRQALVCTVSLWELEDKRIRGRLELKSPVPEWLPELQALPWLELVPTTASIWLRTASLDWAHRDPADRIIAATALEHNVPVLTKDRHFHAPDSPVQAVW